MTKPHVRTLIRNAVLIACYATSGMIGLRLAATGGGYAAPIWLPTGFAVAAVLLYGKALLPGVWIGAFITNFFVTPELSWQNIALASAIATGNSAEALTVRLLLRNFRLSHSFLRLADVKDFIRAAIVGPLVGATIGVTGVSIFHSYLRFRGAAAAWVTWWIGDALGALVLAPVLITLLGEKPEQNGLRLPTRRLLYLLALLGAGLLVCHLLMPENVNNLFVGLTLYSVAIWSTFFLPVRRLFLVAAAICVLAITRAYEGLGLFGNGDIVQRLSLLQFFLGCISVLIMVLNAVISERFSADNLALQHEKALMRADKMSALGEIASGIAHEIGNPLMVIYARTEEALTLLKEGSASLETLAPLLEKIDSMAERIDQIVKSVRFFSRNVEKDPFLLSPVKGIVSDTLELCHEQFRKSGVRLEIEPFPDDLALECKPVLIAQVLLNLLKNARDAAQETPENWVRVSIRQVDQHLEIAVADSGSGIPAEVRRDIFRPFFTTKLMGRGTGLGLSISKTIVESHHGTIALDPDCSNTKFVVSLPLQQPPAAPS